ncbi:MAG TPA: hypothetical protein VF105_01725 [Gemmatimonadaceae bacterium]
MATATALLGLAFAVAVPLNAIWGSPTDTDSQQRILLPSAPAEAFAGEIEYDFDTVFNVTHARYQASLDARGIMARMFLSPPTVHTIVANYQFPGRRVTRVPASVRISLVSDEYVEQPPEPQAAMRNARPLLELNMPHAHASYGIAYAERIVSRSGDSLSPGSRFPQDRHMPVQTARTQLVQITRTATSLLTMCEFLALISEDDVKGTVAGLDFELDRRVIAGLREFASQMKPNEVGTASVSCSDLVSN